MTALQSFLLREKFTLLHTKEQNKKESYAPSNRLELKLINQHDEVSATFIIRTKNMHSAVRMFSRLQSEYARKGYIAEKVAEEDWHKMWDFVVSEYDCDFKSNLWVAIYRHGKPVFKIGNAHPFLDLIEKCHHDTNDTYADSITKAKALFYEAQKDVTIDYDSNVALVINLEDNSGRFGTVLRGAKKTQTFSFRVYPKDEDHPINFSQCLMTASAFLEGIQVAFEIGTNKAHLKSAKGEQRDLLVTQISAGEKYLERLIREIEILESLYKVDYRPEKPNFKKITNDAEQKSAEGVEAA